jgi:hypothetical protein
MSASGMSLRRMRRPSITSDEPCLPAQRQRDQVGAGKLTTVQRSDHGGSHEYGVVTREMMFGVL